MPVDQVFVFRWDDFPDKVTVAISSYVDEPEGELFYARLERRGLKGQIMLPEVEQERKVFILQDLAAGSK